MATIPRLDFDAQERAAIAAEWDRQAREPAPSNPAPVGCLVAVVSLVVLGLVVPWAGRKFFPDPSAGGGWVLMAASAIALLALLGGLGAALFGHGLARGKVRGKAEDAIAWLAQNSATAAIEERRPAAVTVILHAYFSSGPSTESTYDFAEAARQLGEALPYVAAVERALRRERKAYPVFTGEEPMALPD